MHVFDRVDEARFARRDHAGVADAHRVKPALDLGFPKIQEFLQNREVRDQVELLPYIGLQQSGMIGQAVENLSTQIG